jgi:hypothetical protein
MNMEEVKKEVLENSFEEKGKKRLKCEDALRIAAKYQLKPHKIGGVCNRNDIKIAACQLGCFK